VQGKGYSKRILSTTMAAPLPPLLDRARACELKKGGRATCSAPFSGDH
jgi:hypothetical protein